MSDNEDTWAQTQFTLTPEDDAVIREISNTITLSAQADTPLKLNGDSIVHQQALTQKDLIDPEELKHGSSKSTGNQTFLQGVPVVEIPIEYREEATQTLYMRGPCQPNTNYKDVLKSLNDAAIPSLKSIHIAQTDITFEPDVLQDTVMNKFLSDDNNEEFKYSQLADELEIVKTEIYEILNFILSRALWISNPQIGNNKSESKDEEVQTNIIYHNGNKKFIINNETQTHLTCQPKQSNTKLLSDYEDLKTFIQDCINDSFIQAVDVRIIIRGVIDEIIDNCISMIRYPMNDAITQTLAFCKVHGDKEEDIIRKLRLPVILDPTEALKVVIPLLDEILCMACCIVHQDSRRVVDCLVANIWKRTTTVITQLENIRKQVEPSNMDKVFNERKKRLMESMIKKNMETMATQTSIGGVPEITKKIKPKEGICSICPRPSMCVACQGIPVEQNQLLRTQDILIAYKPCYVVKTLAEGVQDPHLSLPSQKRNKINKIEKPISLEKPCDRCDSCEGVHFTSKLRGKNTIKSSMSSWSNIVDTTTKPWQSLKSCSNGGSRSSSSCRSNRESPSTNSIDDPTIETLKILKDAFCTPETCTPCVRNKRQLSRISSRYSQGTNNSKNNIYVETKRLVCTWQTCKSQGMRNRSDDSREK